MVIVVDVMDAIEYLKGYCNKHKRCDKPKCKLWDKEAGCCMIQKDAPCDWMEEG